MRMAMVGMPKRCQPYEIDKKAKDANNQEFVQSLQLMAIM